MIKESIWNGDKYIIAMATVSGIKRPTNTKGYEVYAGGRTIPMSEEEGERFLKAWRRFRYEADNPMTLVPNAEKKFEPSAGEYPTLSVLDGPMVLDILKEIDDYLSVNGGRNSVGAGSILHKKVGQCLEPMRKIHTFLVKSCPENFRWYKADGDYVILKPEDVKALRIAAARVLNEASAWSYLVVDRSPFPEEMNLSAAVEEFQTAAESMGAL